MKISVAEESPLRIIPSDWAKYSKLSENPVAPAESDGAINKFFRKISAFLESKFTFRAIGIFLAILSGVFFTLCTANVKLLKRIDPMETLAFRGLEQVFLSLGLTYICVQKPHGPKEFRSLLSLSGVIGGLTLTGLFFAFHHLPVGDASAIIFSAPVFVMLMGSFFLSEDFTIYRLIALMAMVSGGILIARPTALFGKGLVLDEPLDSIGLGAAFCGTLLYAVNYILTRKLKSVHFSVILFYFSFFTLIVAIFNWSIFGRWVTPEGIQEWILLFTLGVLGATGHSLLALALQYEGAGTVSLARSLDIVLAYVFQIIIFHEIPSWLNILGASLVIFSVVSVTLENVLTEKVRFLGTSLLLRRPSAGDETR